MPRIVSARVIATCPGRNLVTLRMECDDGTIGVGDATLDGREMAVGEIFGSIRDAGEPIENQLIDYIRATVVHAGGITHLRRIAALADLYQARTGCPGATDLSPACMAAAPHFDRSVPDCGIREYRRHTAETDALFPPAHILADGMMHPGDAPGPGVDIDEELARGHEYRRAGLPVNRREDGTLWNW